MNWVELNWKHVKVGRTTKSTSQPNIHVAKIMLCIQWVNAKLFHWNTAYQNFVAQFFCDGIHKLSENEKNVKRYIEEQYIQILKKKNARVFHNYRHII